jgi:hypothetical protein
MNNILEKILAKKSPEEFAKEISEVRKIVGKDNKFDMSVEDALGIPAKDDIIYQEIGIAKDTDKITTINVAEIPCNSSNDIFNQIATNDAFYSMAA